MLYISQGVHLTSSVFKDIDAISLLPNSLFQQISDIALNSPPKQLEFIKWYQKNFLDLETMRKYIIEKLFNTIPQESRINDLWISQQGYNQTDILLQCTNRLEGLLNRIQKGPTVLFPIKEKFSKKNIQKNLEIMSPVYKKKSKIPNLPYIKPLDNEPTVLQNKIIFTRNINLALVGQSYTSRFKSQEITENVRHEDNISIVYNQSDNHSNDIKLPNVSEVKPSTSQKIGTDLSPLYSDRDFAFDTLFQNIEIKRPFSTPLHATEKMRLIRSNSYLNINSLEENKLFEENHDPEYTPKLKFNKADVKFHKLQKL